MVHWCRQSALAVLLLLLLLSSSTTPSHAFSAHLSRPWERPDPNNGGSSSIASLMKRRRRKEQYEDEHYKGGIRGSRSRQQSSFAVMTTTTTTTTTTTSTAMQSSSSSSSNNNHEGEEATTVTPTAAAVSEEQQQQHEQQQDGESEAPAAPAAPVVPIVVDLQEVHSQQHQQQQQQQQHINQQQEEEVLDEEDDDDERMVLEEEEEVPSLALQVIASDHQSHSTTTDAATATTLSIHNNDDNDDDEHEEAPLSLEDVMPKPKPTVLSCRRDLWTMCRPTNYFGVVVFHVLGTYLALQSTATLSTTTTLSTTVTSLRSILLKPQMNIVLLALLLTSSTSMLVNDYYDSRSGVDASATHKPLVSGRVPLPIAKRFLSYCYAALLLCLVAVPGMASRLSLTLGAMLTFWYTQHLKPITWWKNVTCAALIALSPLTSGAAALDLIGGATKLPPRSLYRVFGTLFFGFLGREILMDINDVDDDRDHSVQTVPVKYGRPVASRVALACTLVMSGVVIVGRRRLLLAVTGSVLQTMRAIQVVWTNGEDPAVVERAVEEGKTTVLLLLASFV